jgi:hypothetical protein
VNEPLDHTNGPDTGLGIALCIEPSAPGPSHQVLDVLEYTAVGQDTLAADRVACHARSIGQWPKNELGFQLGGSNDRVLDPWMNWRFLGAHEPPPHADSFSTKRQRRDQPAAVGYSSGCQYYHPETGGGGGNQHKAKDIVFARRPAHSNPSMLTISTPRD